MWEPLSHSRPCISPTTSGCFPFSSGELLTGQWLPWSAVTQSYTKKMYWSQRNSVLMTRWAICSEQDLGIRFEVLSLIRLLKNVPALLEGLSLPTGPSALPERRPRGRSQSRYIVQWGNITAPCNNTQAMNTNFVVGKSRGGTESKPNQ